MTATAPFTRKAVSVESVEISMTARYTTAMWKEKWEVRPRTILAGLWAVCRAEG